MLLVLLRIVQGVAVGGEWGGAVLMAGEHSPDKSRRTFFASFAQLGSPAGLILSMLMFKLVTGLDDAAFLSWGWRVPFLFSAVLLLVGFVIRLSVNAVSYTHLAWPRGTSRKATPLSISSRRPRPSFTTWNGSWRIRVVSYQPFS